MREKDKASSVIGSCIRAGLDRSGMLQKELAGKIGIHPSSLNMMISGAAPLPLRRFYQIAGILNFTQDEINRVNEYYRNKLLISRDHAKKILVNPADLLEKNSNQPKNINQQVMFGDADTAIKAFCAAVDNEMNRRTELTKIVCLTKDCPYNSNGVMDGYFCNAKAIIIKDGQCMTKDGDFPVQG